MIALDRLKADMDRIFSEPLHTHMHMGEAKAKELAAAAEANGIKSSSNPVFGGPNRYAGIEIVTYPIGTRLRNSAGEEIVIDESSAFLTDSDFKVVK